MLCPIVLGFFWGVAFVFKPVLFRWNHRQKAFCSKQMVADGGEILGVVLVLAVIVIALPLWVIKNAVSKK